MTNSPPEGKVTGHGYKKTNCLLKLAKSLSSSSCSLCNDINLITSREVYHHLERINLANFRGSILDAEPLASSSSIDVGKMAVGDGSGMSLGVVAKVHGHFGCFDSFGEDWACGRCKRDNPLVRERAGHAYYEL